MTEYQNYSTVSSENRDSVSTRNTRVIYLASLPAKAFQPDFVHHESSSLEHFDANFELDVDRPEKPHG